MAAALASMALGMTVATPATDAIKSQILQIAALTDRGQRLNKLIAPTYQEKRGTMTSLVNQLIEQAKPVTEADLEGDWELVFSEVEWETDYQRALISALMIFSFLFASESVAVCALWYLATSSTRVNAAGRVQN